MSLFDRLIDQDDSSNTYDNTPLYSVDVNDSTKVLEWLNKNIDQLKKASTSRFQNMRVNLAVYRGIQYKTQDARTGDNRIDSNSSTLSRSPKLVNNFSYEFTENKVNNITQIKPAIEVVPPTGDYTDKIAAKASYMLLQHLWYINNIDDIVRRSHRSKYVLGEQYVFVLWDKDKGDINPSTGQKNGDVSYELEYPYRVFLQKNRDFDSAEFVFRSKVMHNDALKRKYPNSMGRVQDNNIRVFDAELFEDRSLNNETLVHYFYHKPCEYLPEGFYAVFSKDVVLEQGKLPYGHGKLPCVRITDIDIPDVQHGVSFLENIKQQQAMHNNISTMIAKNIYLCAHPKWMMPQGAAKLEALGNSETIVQFRGSMAPQLVSMNPVSRDAYEYRSILRSEAQEIAIVPGVAVGNPPPGITAAVALQFLNERENVRASSEIAKHNQFVVDLAKMSLAVAGEYYDPNDGRMLRILGQDNQYSIKYFDASNFNKDYDVRLQNSTALPQSKSAKLQTILDTMAIKPQLLSDERWVDLLEFGNDKKMYSAATEALRAAESEIESLFIGEEVAEPKPWEDLIVKWRVYFNEMQKRSFKEDLPGPIRDRYTLQVEAIEYLMTIKMQENPLFEAQVAQLAQFPLFYKQAPRARSAEDQAVQKQGDANMGIKSSATIPAATPELLPGESFRSGMSPASAQGTMRPKK
jgi:hypothetical protein